MFRHPLGWLLAGLILFQLSFAQTISNQANAQFNTTTGTGDTPSNTVTVIITPPVTPPVTTDLFKTARPAADTTVTPGQALQYTVTFTNASSTTLTNLVLTDPLDANYRLQRFILTVDGEPVDDDVSDSALDADSNTLTVQLDSLAAGSVLELRLWGFVRSSTPANTVLENQASITWQTPNEDGSSTSDIIRHPTDDIPPPTTVDPAEICALTLTNNGTVANPGQTQAADMGDQVIFSYTLSNPTNAPQVYTLDVRLEPDTTPALSATDVRLVVDSNRNGMIDSAESPTSLVRVSANQSIALLLQVNVPASASSDTPTGSIFVNALAGCAARPSVFDDDNVSSITLDTILPADPTFVKVADASGNVRPGDLITYTLRMSVGSQAVSDIVISDTLNALLADPERLELLVDGNPAGNVRFDTNTREVMAELDTAPAGSTVEVIVAARVIAAAPAGSNLPNQATSTWQGTPTTTSTSTTTYDVATVCSLELANNGTIDIPAITVTALPGDEVTLPYTLTNLGNDTFDFDVTSQQLISISTLELSATTNLIILDSNGNGVRDSGEDVVTTVKLAPGETANLLFVIALPNDPNLAGNLFVNVISVCPDDTDTNDDNPLDDDNISLIRVPPAGMETVEKTAIPEPGAALFPGQSLTYELTATTLPRPLAAVTIVDVFDTRLELPTASDVTVFVNEQIARATVTVNPDDRELRVIVADVPASSHIRVLVDSQVRSDADVSTPLGNTVCASFRHTATSASSETSCSSLIEHPLEPLELIIDKQANRDTVQVGDLLTYTINLDNSGGVPTGIIELRDLLPNGLQYVSGSSQITDADGNTESIDPQATITTQQTALFGSPLEPDDLSWNVPNLNPGQETSISFDVIVLPDAINEDGSITNVVEAIVRDDDGEAVIIRRDDMVVRIERGVFAGRPVLLGTAYIDRDESGSLSADDEPVEGVRVYLPDGVSTVTDEFGHYTFLDVPSGLISVKVDPETLPNRPLKDTYNQERPGFWRLRLFEGTITRQDIPFVTDDSGITFSETVRVQRGDVSLEKTVTRRPRRDALGSTTDEQVVSVVLRLLNDAPDAVSDVIIRDVLPAGAVLLENPGTRDEDGSLVFTVTTLTAEHTLTYTYRSEQTATTIHPPTLTWRLP